MAQILLKDVTFLKRNKIIAFALSVIVCALCISTPFSTVAINSEGEDVHQALADSAVLVAEGDLEYDLIPEDNPNRAYLKGYKGNETRIILPETLGGYPLTSFTTTAFKAKHIEYIRFPSSATSLNAKMFMDSSSLKYIDVDTKNQNLISVDGVVYDKAMTTIYAFPNGVGGSYTIPDTVKKIGQYAFYQCAFITEVIMPNSVESIYREAFAHCQNLANVRMSDNLKGIDDLAFSYCDELRALNLPYSLTYIGNDAFLGYISSNRDRKVYHLTDGLYYVQGSYADEYIKNMHLPNEVKHLVDRKITDYKTGVTIIDPSKKLPQSSKLNLTVTEVPAAAYEGMLPGTFSRVFCYDISFTNDGYEIPLDESVIIRFDNLPDDVIPTGTRVFRIENNNLSEYNRTPHAPFVGASTKNFGTFVIGTSEDFSLKGDINGDKVISSYDAMFTLYLAAELVTVTPAQKNAADYDNDGKITTDDATLILRKAADLI